MTRALGEGSLAPERHTQCPPALCSLVMPGIAEAIIENMRETLRKETDKESQGSEARSWPPL